MLIKVKVQTDTQGKHFIHKKKKVYFDKKCIKLIPKKDNFNLYLQGDGSKYYHIGYRKVFLGNDRDVSKNVCGDLDILIEKKKKDVDNIITKSIEVISKSRKRKKQAKAQKEEKIARVATNVLSIAKSKQDGLTKREEKEEDFSERKQKLTYGAVRAKLIANNEMIDKHKTEAKNRGWTDDQVRRLVKEVRSIGFNTQPPAQPIPTPALQTFYDAESSRFVRYDKNGNPILPRMETVKKPRKRTRTTRAEADKLIDTKIEDFLKLAEEPMYPPPTPLVSTKPSTTTGPPTLKPVEPEVAPPVDESGIVDEGKEEEEDESTPAPPPAPPPAPAPAPPPVSAETKNVNTAFEEINERLLDIQSYIENNPTGVSDYKEHIDLINDETTPEKEGMPKVKTVIANYKKAKIQDYKRYVAQHITHYVESNKANPFENNILKKFGVKREVEIEMRKHRQIEEIKAQQPLEITSYGQLNHLVDGFKNNAEFKSKAIEGGIKKTVNLLTKLRNKTNLVPFYDEVIHLTKKYKKGNKSSLPKPLYDLLTNKTGKMGRNIYEDASVANKLGAIQTVESIPDEQIDLDDAVYQEDIFDTIKHNIKIKYGANSAGKFTDDNALTRAFAGDALDEADKKEVKQSNTITVKKLTNNANFLLNFDTGAEIDKNEGHNHEVHGGDEVFEEEEEEETDEDEFEGEIDSDDFDLDIENQNLQDMFE